MRRAVVALALLLAGLSLGGAFSSRPAHERIYPPEASAQSGEGSVHPMGDLWGTTAFVASSNLFSSNLVPGYAASVMRVTVSLTTSQVLYVSEDNGGSAGGGTKTVSALNGGSALTANCDYTFSLSIRQKDRASPQNTLGYNFQVGGGTSVNKLRLEESTSPGF